MVAETVLPLVSTLLGGGLVLGLLRLRPERQNLIADATERAVSSLLKSMDEMDERLAEAADREAELQNSLSEHRREINLLRQDLAKRRAEIVALQLERDAWKQRAIDSGWNPPE